MLAIASLGLLCVPAAAAQEQPRPTEAVRAGACGQRMLALAATVAITPDGDGTADCAVVRIRLERPATVELVVAQRKPQPRAVHVQRAAASRGLTTLVWTPGPEAAARTYVTRVTVVRPGTRVRMEGPVIRVRGIHARFARESYAPGDVASLRVELCSECHPFYTGKQKLVDTGGRVERFQRRLEKAGGSRRG